VRQPASEVQSQSYPRGTGTVGNGTRYQHYRGSRPLRQGQDESSRRVAKRNKAMEALGLFILSIDHQRVNGNFGPARTLYRIPQQGASEFAAVIGDGDGLPRDWNRPLLP
jgi:hypothetical protein